MRFAWKISLHDLARDQELLTVADYTALMENVTDQLVATGARLLWVSTTPVPTNKTDPSSSLVEPPRFNSDVVAFNAAAAKIMAARNIRVFDLYSVVIAHCGEGYSSCDWQLPNNVHYEKVGWSNLAESMAEAVQSLVAAD